MENPTPQPILSLRRDLHFTLQQSKDRAYIVEDPLRQKYFRIGNEEYLFLTHLNGQHSLGQAIAKTNELLGTNVFDEQHARVIVQWLINNQLISDDNQAILTGRLTGMAREKQQKTLSRFNMLTIKIPLGNPDAIFMHLSPWLGWFTGPVFALFWCCTLLYGGTVLVDHWPEFIHQAASTLSPGNLVFIWLAWFILKILHELSHALTCYRYHGRVYEAGLLFILFFPLTYINASSSWSFPSRWQRIHTAVAGIYAELFIASLAILIWTGSPNTITGEIAHNLIMVAGFSSLLFNANPLMRFDGYFILSDIVDIPNLYARGREFAGSVLSAVFFGKWTYIARFSPAKEILVRCYGLASWFWRILVMTSLILLASGMFHGLGIFVAILSICISLGLPAWSLKNTLAQMRRENPSQFKHFLLSSIGVTAIFLILLNFVHLHTEVSAPAVVQYADEATIKAVVPGIIAVMHVHSGQKIHKDDPILQLENPELLLELSKSRIELRKLELQERNTLINEDLSKYQVLTEQRIAIRQKLASLEKDVNDLTILAPLDGVILGKNLDQKIGVYLKSGQVLLSIVSEKDKKLLASVSQDDIEAFRDIKNEPVEVCLHNTAQSDFLSTIKQVHPKASTLIPDKAFSAAYGGPVAVRQSLTSSPYNDRGDRQQQEFFKPRFQIDIEIPGDKADLLLAGQRATIRTSGQSVAAWQVLKKTVSKYFRRKLARGSADSSS
jgi:putative peptide zinc metalloprotease protein